MAEELFSKEEKYKLMKDYAQFSKENKMAKRKLLDYFGLMELENTKFANRFFNVVKSSNPKLRDFSPYLTYAKFISTIAQLTRGYEKDRYFSISHIQNGLHLPNVRPRRR